MRIEVEASQDGGIEIPQTFCLNVDRIEVVDVLDQWYGPDDRLDTDRKQKDRIFATGVFLPFHATGQGLVLRKFGRAIRGM